eukprot:1161956-Pelagomonas_calceolata.AAC.19
MKELFFISTAQAQADHDISALQQHMRVLNGLVQQAEKTAQEAQHSLAGWVPPDEVEEIQAKVCVYFARAMNVDKGACVACTECTQQGANRYGGWVCRWVWLWVRQRPSCWFQDDHRC